MHPLNTLTYNLTLVDFQCHIHENVTQVKAPDTGNRAGDFSELGGPMKSVKYKGAPRRGQHVTGAG